MKTKIEKHIEKKYKKAEKFIRIHIWKKMIRLFFESDFYFFS